MHTQKITIEVWSDIACPFCFLGKRTLEQALLSFSKTQLFDVTWRSFQLNPTLQTDTQVSTFDYLQKHKGIPSDQVRKMTQSIAQRGTELGIHFDFEHTVVSNTHKAHEALHYALEHGKQNAFKESLFLAHFSQGKNVDDLDTLSDLIQEVGLDTSEFKSALAAGKFTPDVDKDQQLAMQLGIRGVPFFVIDGKYAISGAQPMEVFTETFEKILQEQE
jgi:predicted DsbA family dithiol-disulfide isomerase